MSHSHEFPFGSAILFLDTEKSVHVGDKRRPAGGTRSVTLYVKDPGDMFHVGRLGTLQKRVKSAVDHIFGTSVGVVNLSRITLYDQSIHSYADGVEVAEYFVTVFNERFKQALAAIVETDNSQQQSH